MSAPMVGTMESTPTTSKTSLSFTASSSSYIFTMQGVAGADSPPATPALLLPSGRLSASSMDSSDVMNTGAPPHAGASDWPAARRFDALPPEAPPGAATSDVSDAT